jgi:hypothetical protein
LVYAADVNILGGRINTVQKNRRVLVVVSNDIGQEMNADKTKYQVMSREQNAGRSHNMKIVNSSFERVEEFKYFTTNLTDQNSILEEIKSSLKSRNACYHSVQHPFLSSLLSKNINIKIHTTIVFPVALYGCETLSLTVREERRLIVFQNRMLRRMFGHKRDEVRGEWRRLHSE